LQYIHSVPGEPIGQPHCPALWLVYNTASSEKGFMMSRIIQLVVVLTVVGGLAWAVSSFAIANSDEQTSRVERAAVESSDLHPAGAFLLAARYHLRTRTTRFFRRSTGHDRSYRGNRYYRGRSVTPAPRPSDIRGEPASPEKTDQATRYHLRTRTTRFFRRAIAADLATSQDLQLAARYHLRTRTTRFFRRATA